MQEKREAIAKGASDRDRIIVDSSADWGISNPFAVPKTAQVRLDPGIREAQVRAVCYENALKAYSQSGQMNESDWLNPQSVDRAELFNGNTVFRGQEPTSDSIRKAVLIE